MNCGRTAITPKSGARNDACEIFHKVVALPSPKPDNDQASQIFRRMQTALPNFRSTSID
jgi:hypothetical protein